MDWKTALFILAIVLIVIVFYQQISKGCPAKSASRPEKEGMDDGSALGSGSVNPTVCPNNDYSDPKNLPLREYYIKASYNTAYDGTNVSMDTIKARLAEGYRFIDFNVFCASGQQVFVGFSQGNTPTLDSGSMLFSDALNTIAQNAFTKPTAAVNGATAVSWDYTNLPLIVNIRVFRAPGSKVDVIGNVANVINPQTTGGASAGSQLASNFYYTDSPNNPILVDGCTSLGDIGPKILFTMNIENILQVYTPSGEFAQNVPDYTIAALDTFVNFLSGGSTCVAFYSYDDPSLVSRTNTLLKNNNQIKGAGAYQSNIQYMSVVFPYPSESMSHPDIRQFSLNASVLILPMRVYAGSDSNLALNTKIFDDRGTAFVPASNLRSIIDRVSG